MNTRLDRVQRALPAILAVVALIGIVLLCVWNVAPAWFPARAHDFLAAFPLAVIAIAYLVYQAVRRPARWEWVKAVMLAAAFLCWAANQLWPESRWATLLNDIAIGLFVFDVFLVIIGWPANSPDESFGESSMDQDNRPVA